MVQRQEKKEEEKPLAEGLKTAAENLAEHKAALLIFLGLNLGTAATAFALNPGIRKALSDVNIGKPLGWVPYSPVEGLKYQQPEAGKPAYGFPPISH